MNQLSDVGFGNDATVLAGYAQTANAQLGNVDVIVENIGTNSLFFVTKQYPVAGAVSGYANIGNPVTIVPSGVKTISYNIVSKRIGFFGSGNTRANITIAYRNKADLRGAQIDIVATGRRGWGYDDAFDKPTLTKKWGSPPDDPSIPPV